MAREWVERYAADVFKAWKQLAAGRPVRHYNQQTGEYLYTEREIDAATLRHWVNKLLADAPQEVDLKGKIAHTVISNTRDPDAED